jgi:hypothetical protein
VAWKQEDLDRIDAAIAGNVRSVTFADGRSTAYQDVDKMLAVRNQIKAELQAAQVSASGRFPRATRARMRRP